MAGPATLAVLVFQAGTFALFAEAVRRRHTPAAVNALGAFVLAALPVLVQAVSTVSVGAALPVWLAAAAFLHSLGMLGLYDSVWWWDHLTHTISGLLVAALVYAACLVALPARAGIDGRPAIAAVTLVFAFAAGVFWELIELAAREVSRRYDIDELLVYYGWQDTALDLVFDVLAAVAVVALDLRLFVSLVEQFPRATGTALLGSGGVVVGGSVLLAAFVWFGRLAPED